MPIHNKDDIEFVAEFPCLLGHPVSHFTVTVGSVFFMINVIKTN